MKYLVRLKPLDPFFFGGNRTFSTYYIARSERFPQQTHLLGMIRRVLLEKKGLLKLGKPGWGISGAKEKEAAELVGVIPSGQNYSQETLGKIRTLSPVFLVSVQENCAPDFHFILPKDTGFKLNPTCYPNCIVSLNGIQKSEALCFDGFDYKNGLKEGLTAGKFWENYCSHKEISDQDMLAFDKVYEEVWQMGIRRKDRTVNEDEDGSVYKKYSYLLKKGFEFGFLLDTEEDLFGERFERQIYLGAERSFFQMVIEPCEKDFLPTSKTQGFSKAVALSEYFAEEDLFQKSRFVFNSGYTPFGRLLPTQNSTSNSYQTNKMAQTNLLPRGSVIFFNEKRDNELKKDDFYTRIGFNHFVYV
jgi:CRISPR-associated protein Cmr3